MADFIDEALREWEIRTGTTLNPAQLATEFSKHGHEARVFHLKTLESTAEMPLREAARRLAYTRALENVHHRLNRISR